MPYLKGKTTEDFSSETMMVKRKGNKTVSLKIFNELSTQKDILRRKKKLQLHQQNCSKRNIKEFSLDKMEMLSE